MNDLSQYDALQARVEAAYMYHVKTWTMMHPPPAQEEANISRLDLIVAFSLVLLVLASVIVSGSRTIAEFGSIIGGNIGIVVGVFAFIMLEIALVIYAFFDSKKSGVHSNRYVIRAARGGLLLAFIVTIFANVHATMSAEGTEMSPVLDLLVILMLAISAPTLALISGHILGNEVVSIVNQKSEVAKAYRIELREWETAMNRSWDAQKSKLGVKIEIVNETPSALVSGVSADDPDRLTPSQQKVYDYLEMNPNSASLGVRELAAATQTNRDAASKGKGLWLRNQQQDG